MPIFNSKPIREVRTMAKASNVLVLVIPTHIRAFPIRVFFVVYSYMCRCWCVNAKHPLLQKLFLHTGKTDFCMRLAQICRMRVAQPHAIFTCGLLYHLRAKINSVKEMKTKKPQTLARHQSSVPRRSSSPPAVGAPDPPPPTARHRRQGQIRRPHRP